MRRLFLPFALSLGLAAPILAGAGPAAPVAERAATGLKWDVKPGTVVIYLDGEKVGAAKDVKRSPTKPGMHTIRLVHGEDETEFDVMVKKGHMVELRYEFTDG